MSENLTSNILPFASVKNAAVAIPKIPARSEVFRAIVDDLFHVQEVHLLAGPSGVGKSRWLTKMIQAWLRGESIFGHASHPAPFVYISLDRSFRDVVRLLYDIGIDPETWPIVAIDENSSLVTIESVLNFALKRYPAAKLLVIEGIGMMVPGGKVGDYHTVTKYLKGLASFCKKNDATIIGTTHCPKVKKGEEYQLARETVLGSVAWGGAYTQTILAFQPKDVANSEDPGRVVTILPRLGATKIHHMAFQTDDTGHAILVPTADPRETAVKDETEARRALNMFLRNLEPADKEFSAGDVQAHFAALNPPVSRRTAFAAIADAESRGVLVKLKRGRYRQSTPDALDLSVNPPESYA